MAYDPLSDAWDAYKEAVDGYHGIVQSALDEDRELFPDGEVAEAERALQDVVERSQAVTEIGEAQLRLLGGARYDRVAVCLLAAGAVDVAVACEALRICPDRPAVDPVVVTGEHEAPATKASVLVGLADELFGNGDEWPGGDDWNPEGGDGRGGGRTPPKPAGRPSGGAQGEGVGGTLAEAAGRKLAETWSGKLASEGGGLPSVAGGAVGRVQLELSEAADESLRILIADAAGPGLGFATGAIPGITAGFHITAGAEPLERLGVLAQHVGVIKRRLVRLLASGFKKLLGASGATSRRLAGEGLGVIEGGAFDFAERPLLGPFRNLLGWLVRYESAKARADSAIEPRVNLRSEDAKDIERKLRELTEAYKGEMVWTGRIAQWLSWAAPFISTLAVHVGGPVVVVGLNALGAGFVLYTLDVRVDGHGLPARVRSVVQIVDEELASLS